MRGRQHGVTIVALMAFCLCAAACGATVTASSLRSESGSEAAAVPNGPGAAAGEPDSRGPAILRPEGSFRLSAPGVVEVGSTFVVRATEVDGGTVAVEAGSGPCEPTGTPDTYTASGSGACVFEASHTPAPTHRAAPSVAAEVMVRRPAPGQLPLGRFSLDAPGKVEIGVPFFIGVRDTLGGVVTVGSESSRCTPADAGPASGAVDDLDAAFWFVAGDEGSCDFVARQTSTSGHRASPKQEFSVTAAKGIGRFTIVAPSSVFVDDVIDLGTTDVVGGRVEFVLVPGAACQADGAGGFEAEATGVCQFEAVQSETDSHEAAPVQGWQVAVSKRQGSFVISVPDPLVLGVPATIEVIDAVGPQPVLSADSASCVVDGRQLTAVELAPCRLVARQLPSNAVEPAPEQEFTIAVVRPVGSYDFTVDSPVTVGQAIGIRIANEVGGRVRFEHIDGDACEYDYYSDVWTAIDTGTCTFEATQGPDDTYEPAAPQTRVVEVGPAPREQGRIEVEAPDRTVVEGDTFVVIVTVVVGDAPGPPVVSGGGVCTRTGSDPGRDTTYWVYEARQSGTCTFTVTQPTTGEILGDERSVSVEVRTGVTSTTDPTTIPTTTVPTTTVPTTTVPTTTVPTTTVPTTTTSPIVIP